MSLSAEPVLAELAREYIARQEGRSQPHLEWAICCNSVAINAITMHKRGFVHMVIVFNLQRAAFRRAIEAALAVHWAERLVQPYGDEKIVESV